MKQRQPPSSKATMSQTIAGSEMHKNTMWSIYKGFDWRTPSKALQKVTIEKMRPKIRLMDYRMFANGGH